MLISTCMDSAPADKRNLGRTLVVYLGTAGVFIEFFNFLVSKYGLEGSFPDALVILVIFGLPAALVHEWHYRRLTRRALGMHLINALLAITVIFYSLFNPDKLRPTELRLLKFRANQKELASSVRSIAILPLVNLTGDEGQNLWLQGMHEELISQMGSAVGIRIPSRTSTLAFANSNKSLHEIAGALHVDAVIEGSMLPAEENNLKIQLRLIGDMPNELQLWARSYELNKEQILELYGDIIRSVSDEINVALSPEKETALQKPKTVDPVAYEFYLKGRTNFSFLTPEMVELAEQNFEKSLEIDPQFAPAYAGLAGVWIARKQLGFPGYTPMETEPKYTEYIQKSFALDSTDADVWRMYATKLAYEYDWQGCSQAIERCLKLNPNFAEAHAINAHFAMMQSNWHKAWEAIDRALEQDPMNPLVQGFYAVMLTHSGRFEELRKQKSHQMGSDLDFFFYGMQNMQDSVVISLRNNSLRDQPGIADLLEETYQKEGYARALNVLADTLVSLSDHQYVNAAFITLLYQLAENKDKTVEWIERMYIRKDPNLPYFAIRHPSKPRWWFEEPRIREVMRRINLWE